MAKKYSDLELSCANKIVTKHKNQNLVSQKTLNSLKKIIPDLNDDNNMYFKSIKNLRKTIIKKNLNPLLRDQFKNDVKNTGNFLFNNLINKK